MSSMILNKIDNSVFSAWNYASRLSGGKRNRTKSNKKSNRKTHKKVRNNRKTRSVLRK